MADYTQLGIAGVLAGILFFTVRYFVASINKKDEVIEKLNDKFVELASKDIESRIKNTESNDKLTSAIYQLIKRQ